MSGRINNPEFLVNHWPLNGHVNDITGGLNMTWTGTETYLESIYNRKLTADFDGSTQYLKNSISNFRSTDSKGTISLWIKFDDVTTSQTFFNVAYEGGTNSFLTFALITTSKLKLDVDSSAFTRNTTTGTQVLKINTWYHVVLMSDGTNYKIYIDGEVDTQTFSSGSDNGNWLSDITETTDNVMIAALERTSVIGETNGSIQDVRYYNTNLTQDEVRELFHQGKPIQKEPEQPKDTLPDLGDTSLKGSWLNKAVKGTGVDYSTNQDDMTNVNNVLYPKIGGDFDGSTNYFRRAESDWQSSDSAGTISAWIKIDATGATHTIFNSDDEGSNNYRFEFKINSSNQVEILQKNNDTSDIINGTTTTFAAGQWYYVTLVSSGTAYSLYVNGNVEGLNASSGSNNGDWLTDTDTPNRDNVIIGVRRTSGTGEYFNGNIKDVRYYSEAKTADFIKAEFEAGVPDDSLVLHVLDGTKDLSKQKNVLTNNNGTIVGKDMDFDGTDDYITITYNTNLTLSTQGALSCWVKVNNPAAAVVKPAWDSNDGSSEREQFYFDIYNGTIRWIVGDNGFNSTTAFTSDSWKHIVLNKSVGQAPTLYIDGVLSDTAGTSNDFVSNTDSIFIGARETSPQFFDGKIKDVKLFNKAKSADWVAQEYSRTKRFY